MQACNFTKKRLRDSEVDCFWTIPVDCFRDFAKNSKLSSFFILEATVFFRKISALNGCLLKNWNIETFFYLPMGSISACSKTKYTIILLCIIVCCGKSKITLNYCEIIWTILMTFFSQHFYITDRANKISFFFTISTFSITVAIRIFRALFVKRQTISSVSQTNIRLSAWPGLVNKGAQ